MAGLTGITARLAVPTEGVPGLGSARSQHFGHCDCFTIVDIDDGQVKGVSGVTCPPHEEGGCLRPVKLLADAGVTAVVVYGMGERPFNGLVKEGIAVLREATEPNVGKAAQMVAEGRVEPMPPEAACSHSHG